MKINLNESVTVTLTAAGARIYNGWMEQFPPDTRQNVNAGQALKLQLWSLMQAFGASFYMGMPEVPFAGNEVELHVPAGVALLAAPARVAVALPVEDETHTPYPMNVCLRNAEELTAFVRKYSSVVGGVNVLDGLAGAIAYQLTKQLVIDMPTARAAVDAAIAGMGADYGGKTE